MAVPVTARPAAALTPGTSLSYSAGSRSLDPWAFRVLAAGDKLSAAVRLFPEMSAFLTGGVPLFLNGYPAAIGSAPGAVTIDSYMRPQTVSRGLLLAAETGCPIVLAAQPLPALHFLLRHHRAGLRLPERLVCCVGGYPCPPSLEHAMRDVAAAGGMRLFLLHAYGVGEVDAACLMGAHRVEGEVRYRRVSERIRPVVHDGELALSVLDADGIARDFRTGDRGVLSDSGVIIHAAPERVHPALLRIMGQWDTGVWHRRTGYAAYSDGRWAFQLREDVSEPGDAEVEHWSFARRFGFSWLDKPHWGMK